MKFFVARSWRIISLTLTAVLIFPSLTHAQAKMYIAPASGTYKVGDSFSVLFDLDTGGKVINVASAKLNFDKSRLAIKDIGYSRSLLTLWTEEPKFSNSAGTISFSGGLPNPGYNGSSGAVLRVTFIAKAPGTAPVLFSSGSMLANDGTGTNILENLDGAIFNITGTGIYNPSAVTSSTTQAVGGISKPISAPALTLENPPQINEGDVISVQGLALPNSKLIFYIQKDSDNPISEVGFAGPDGRFEHTFYARITPGNYRVWGRNVASDGTISDASDPLNVMAVESLPFRIVNIAVAYFSVILALLSIFFILLILFFIFWIKHRKDRRAQGVEISEAERSLHSGFDNLKAGLERYVDYLSMAKTPKNLKTRDAKVKKGVRTDLDIIEKKINKEIDDIRE